MIRGIGLAPHAPPTARALVRWHYVLGVSLGPITGKLVAQIISGEKPEVDLAPMSPARF